MIQTKLIRTDLSSKVQLRFESLIKGTVASATDLRHYPHSVCDILFVCSRQQRGDLIRAISIGSVESQLLYPSAVCSSQPNRTYKGSSDLEVGSLGSELIYTQANTCQFEVRDQCFRAHFTRKGDNGRQQQTAITA